MPALIHLRLKITIVAAALALLLVPAAWSQVQILSNRYDNGSTGANLNETSLNSSNVNADQFGKLGSYQIDGNVYAQPLYVPNVKIASCVGCTGSQGTYNVLYIVTMNDTVYAFDADTIGPPLLTLDVTAQIPGSTPIPVVELSGGDSNIVGNVGIESTPVIDPVTNTMYLLARTEEDGNYVQRLHALDTTNFSEKFGGPVTIQASVPGTADDAVDGQVIFNPKTQNQRVALALSNGVVLIAWGSHGDILPYHGWIIGYDASTLQQVPGAFCDTPDGAEGGIWQSGRGPAIDSNGNAYYESGNGDWDGIRNFGESLFKLGVSADAGLTLLDWFTPGNYSYLSNNDLDLSSGPMSIPNSNLVLGSGKESVFYLLNADNLGQEVDGDTQTVQDLGVYGGNIKNGPAYWPGITSTGPLVYIWPDFDVLKAYHFNGSTLDTNIFAQGPSLSPGSPGGALTVTSNGDMLGSGIVWASLATDMDGDQGTVAGVLRAYNAENLAEIWNSEINPDIDRLGTLSKFVPPTVVNGKVYMATQDNAVAVYGFVSLVSGFSISTAPSSTAVIPGGNVSFSTGVSFMGDFSGSVTLSAVGLPPGVSASFSPSSLSASGSATLNLATSENAPVGTYTISIVGDGGSISHSSDINLVVTRNAGDLTISIDFVGLGTAMGSVESAGVVSKPNWNNAFGNVGSMGLNNETGAATGTTVNWSSDNVWATNISDSAGNFRMMNGYLDTGNANPTTVNVSGLPANANGYTVYVYVDGDNGGQVHTGIYQISGTGISVSTVSLADAANANFAGIFTQANNSTGNYVVLATNGGVSGFTLTATPDSSSGAPRAPVNGIQIIPSGIAPSPDFSVNATPAAQSIAPGGQTSFTVNLAPVNGFSGTTTLSASGLPTGASASFSPASIGGSGSATLSVLTSSSVPVGTYTVSITGASGSLSHSTTVSLAVNAASSGENAISIDFVGLGTAMGSVESAGVVSKPDWNNAFGNVGSMGLNDETGAATGATVNWSSDNVWATNISDSAGNFRMMNGYLDTGNANPTTVNVSGLPANANGYTVYVYVDGDNGGQVHTGIYQISGTGISVSTVSLADAANANFAGIFTQANNSTGNYVVLATNGGVSGFTLTATPDSSSGAPRAPVNGIQIIPSGIAPSPDFSVNATPAAQSIAPGGQTSFTVNLAPVNGFSGTTTLSASGLPTGASASFSPASIGGSGSATLSVLTSSSVPVGTYTVSITGASGSLSHSTTVSLAVNAASSGENAISIDFVGLGTAMGSVESAGVVSKPDWNNAFGNVGSMGLNDETGAATGATVNWSSDNVWATNISDSAGNFRMMNGYLDTGNANPTTVNVSGLPANANGYTVYVYVDGDNGGATHSGTYQLSGPGTTSASISLTDPSDTNFTGAFIQAKNSIGNYLLFNNITGSAFTVTATPGQITNGNRRAPVNGIQIIPNQ